MKILFQLFVAIILIPTSLHADSNKFDQVYQYQRTHYCSDYYFYEDAEEYRSACFSLGGDANYEQIDIKAYIRCQPSGVNCDGLYDYRAYCQIDNAGPEVVQVLNKTHVIVDIQPEDCDPDSALNSVGTQFSAIANGRVKERFDYANYFLHAYQLDRQCIIHSKGGSQEARLADMEAVIEGKAVANTGVYIYTITTDSLFNPCSLPW
jgi:hypothetical protein